MAVSSNSNAAINHVLKKAQGCLDARRSDALMVKASTNTSHVADGMALVGSRAQALKEADLPANCAVLGGTVFALVKEAHDGAPFDLLVIDEAGQVSLSNLLVMGRVARNILLVGDQQQLSQPSRADHPGESGLSCLDYVMQDHAVVPADRGVFLATSWRMPPGLTEVVSELFYEGQLHAAAGNTVNRVDWDGQPQGLMFQPVDHSGNSTGSEEEVEQIAALLERLHGRPYQLANGEQGTLGGDQILITAPYNVQVNRLKRRLGSKARVGTVDKFQGQEAPVEIASGGRYDALVGRFCQDPAQAAGVGFGFDIEAVRELVAPTLDASMPVLVAYSRDEDLATALDHLEALHQASTAAELLSGPTASQAEAQAIGEARGCSRTVWITP